PDAHGLLLGVRGRGFERSGGHGRGPRPCPAFDQRLPQNHASASSRRDWRGPSGSKAQVVVMSSSAPRRCATSAGCAVLVSGEPTALTCSIGLVPPCAAMSAGSTGGCRLRRRPVRRSLNICCTEVN